MKKRTLSLLSFIDDGGSPTQFYKMEKITKKKLNRSILILKEQGLIRKIGYGTWETTEKGKKERRCHVSHGGCEPSKIDCWKPGYKFTVYKGIGQSPIPGLKYVPLKNGGYRHQGFIADCWVMQGKDTISIYAKRIQGDNLNDIWQKAMLDIAEAKMIIEEQTNIRLEALEEMKPDIILNEPELQQIAKETLDNVGRVRAGDVEVDKSKTGKPELEARTFETAQKVLYNLQGTKLRDDIEALKQQMVNVSVAIPLLAKYAEYIEKHLVAIETMTTHLGKMNERLDDFAGKKEVTIQKPLKLTLIDSYGLEHNLDMKPGMKIYLPQYKATELIAKGEAI